MAGITLPPYGIYTPLVIFFNEDESIDLESTKAHIKRMAQGGVAGLVLQGSNGEAPHLTHEERRTIVKETRTYLHSLGYHQVNLIVGCGAPSVRETLQYIDDAKLSGAQFALALPPAYWSAAMTPAVIEGFFSAVAESPALPLLIYNFPGVASGIDISSDLIIKLAKKHPGKIVGVKLTCGNLGKLHRISSSLPRDTFTPFGGKSDFFLPALIAGSNGVIAALANVAPKLHKELLRLYEASDMKAAIALQNKLSHADWALSKQGVAGVKAVVSHFYGYGSGQCRKPIGHASLSTFSSDDLALIEEIISLENTLP